MNIINKITINNLKENKKRTIVTILGVMLSAALICAVVGFGYSFRETYRKALVAFTGEYHYSYKHIDKSDLKYIKYNPGVKKISYIEYLGMKFDKNDERNNLLIKAISNYDERKIKLAIGRFPKKDDEIILSLRANMSDEYQKKLGDKIVIDIIPKMNDYYWKEKVSNGSMEEHLEKERQFIELASKKESKLKEYKVVGFYEEIPGYLREYNSKGSIAITYNNKENIMQGDDIEAYVLFEDARNAKNVSYNIEDSISKKSPLFEVTKNEELLRVDGKLSGTVMDMIYLLVGFIVFLIVLSSVFVIRNSFMISVIERTRQIGMLESLGATKKQIKKSVLLEAFIIGLIGIPLGIVLGNLAVYVVLKVLNLILVDILKGEQFIFSFNYIGMIITIVVGFFTVYLSALLPAIKAGKISPIESIRSNNDIKIEKKKIKAPKIIKKLFGVGGRISYKNLKRSRKKYRTTVISLVVSITIFITLSSFTKYMFKEEQRVYGDDEYNIILNFENKTEDVDIEAEKQKEQILNKVLKLDNIDKYKMSKRIKGYYEKNGKYANSFLIEVMDKNSFKEFANKSGIYSNLDNRVLLADTIIKIEDGKYKYVNSLGNLKNQELKFRLGKDDKIEDHKIKITDRLKDITPENRREEIAIYLSENNKDKDIVDSNYAKYERIEIYSKSPYKLEKDLKTLRANNIDMRSIGIYNEQEYKDVKYKCAVVISIFLYGFIIVITLIGITNIFNTITANMILRSKEFASLKSLGMTDKEFKNMIRLETILYSIKALVYGIILGTFGSYIIYLILNKKMEFAFMISTKSILISVISVFIIIGLTMKYSMNKINKQNIIETIRKENI